MQLTRCDQSVCCNHLSGRGGIWLGYDIVPKPPQFRYARRKPKTPELLQGIQRGEVVTTPEVVKYLMVLAHVIIFWSMCAMNFSM